MDPQAAAPFGLDCLRVPGLRLWACQPVLDVATQLLKLPQPQLILLLNQAGLQILQVEGLLLQPQGSCSIDA